MTIARLDFDQGERVTDKAVSGEQVAILTERVDTLITQYSEFRGMVLAIATSQAVHVEKIGANDAALNRAFAALDDHDRRIDVVAADVKVHSWTWKLVGSFCLVAVGLTGWALGELRALQRVDSEHEKRITLQEFIVGGRSGQSMQRQQEVQTK